MTFWCGGLEQADSAVRGWRKAVLVWIVAWELIPFEMRDGEPVDFNLYCVLSF